MQLETEWATLLSLFSLKEVPILGDVLAPFAGNPELIENCVHWADHLAIGTVDTGDRVDVEHLLFVGRSDAIYRTYIQARRILNPDTGLGYHERHGRCLCGGLEFKAIWLMVASTDAHLGAILFSNCPHILSRDSM